jgi:hypothetical protein
MKYLIRPLVRMHMVVLPSLTRARREERTIIMPFGVKFTPAMKVHGLMAGWETRERGVHRLMRAELHRGLHAQRS